MEPLTVPLTEEQMKRKIAQQKEKAPPPGTSRILSRATREQKKNQKIAAAEAAATGGQPLNPRQVPPNNKQTSEQTKTTEPPSKSVTRTDNTAQNEIEEWQNLAEELNPEVNFELCEKMIQDTSFLNRFKQSLFNSKTQMLEAKIEGASMFRELCKILCNLLTIEFGDEEDDEEELNESMSPKTQGDLKKSKISTARNKKPADLDAKQTQLLQIQNFEKFCNFLELPQFFTELFKQFLNEKSNFKNFKEVKLLLFS